MKLSQDAQVIVRRHNKVVYKDGDRLVKVFNDEKPSSDVFNEALNDARIEETDILVPQVLEVSQVEGGEHDGAWALATRYVPGKSLHEMWMENPEKFSEYLDRLVGLQIDVQSHHAPLINRQKDKLNRMISATRGLVDATDRYDLHIRLDGMRAADYVCHGDFIPSNIIVTENDELYLCDWAHVTAGLPEVDAALTYLLFSINHPDQAEDYINAYCKKADVARQVINYWLPVVAAAELARGRKENEEFLKSWINIHD